jgi:streptogramin lyase
VAVDPQGNVYVADHGNNSVQKFSARGAWLAGHGLFSANVNVAPVGALQNYYLSYPYGIGADAHGHVFVTDSEDQCLAVYSSTLELQGCWGTVGNGINEWVDPRGVAVDRTGHVYVADNGNQRIVKLSPPATHRSSGLFGLGVPFPPTFQFLRTWGTNGRGPGQLLSPIGVAVDGHGNLFVVDSVTCRVQELSPAGNLLAAWGRSGTRPGEFRDPQGIAVDTQGNVYVADSGNNRVQEFAPG